MYYAGIDYHKRYSFVSIQNESGQIVLEHKITDNNPYLCEGAFAQIDGDMAVVYEASFNWGWLCEVLVLL